MMLKNRDWLDEYTLDIGGEDVKGRKIDGEMLQEFINKHFKSNLDFSKSVGISYSHLYYILKEWVEISCKTMEKFEKVFSECGENINSFMYPEPLVMNGLKIKQIDVFKEDELVCSITSKDIIYRDDIKVECRPY
ncbi:hypothetical protein SAMN00017477_1058 [Peptoniphilus asaccharolyticus DSM 20463]|uniref:Uncharacterized protein n=2 Tax=Peptoniphilus asaccharolyticus TaxID=1258 RepID=A0A1W1V1I5_PEPAS|nr:hypothetical protein SAMN00017477_1058 [Peptoniphilus asaccharolyticus DSM 20463]